MSEEDDIRFGKAAIDLGLCSNEQVREALAIQDRRREHGHAGVLGHVLVQLGYLKPQDIPRVLLRQNRREITCPACQRRSAATGTESRVQCPWCGEIFAPFSASPKTPRPKSRGTTRRPADLPMNVDADKHFGRAAVELGYCSQEQVRECLDIQQERRRRGERVVLGYVLVEKGYLDPDHVPQILQHQNREEVTCPACARRSAATHTDRQVQCPWCGHIFSPWPDQPKHPKGAPRTPRPGDERSEPALAILVVTSPQNPAESREVSIYSGIPLHAGRLPEMEIQVDDPAMSRKHCRFYEADGQIYVEDLKSHNGTLVNGRSINRPVALDFGDEILLGDTRAVLAPVIEDAGNTCQRCGRRVGEGAKGGQRIEEKLYCGVCLADHVVPGRMIGSYRSKERIGRGGMAEVWSARDEENARTVALKVLLEPSKVKPQSKQRFLKEAAAGARLRHPGLVEIFERGEHEGIPYIAMEYVRGISLARRLDEERRLPREQAIRIAIDVARTLAYAHEHHVIHRDVKPANIVLDESSGRARLLDLGVVKVDDMDESLTRTGTGLGTLEYAPPEQIADAKRVDHRADLYSLGATLYRMVCGHRPYGGGGPLEIARAIIHKPVPWSDEDLEAAGRSLPAIINRCMAKRPEDRYATGTELAQALEVLLEIETVA